MAAARLMAIAQVAQIPTLSMVARRDVRGEGRGAPALRVAGCHSNSRVSLMGSSPALSP